MEIRRISLDQWATWWAAADGKIRQMRGKGNWFKRLIRHIYDMGENFNILAQWKLKMKDVNWFSFPGRENCSGLFASIAGAGFDAIRWLQLYPWKGMPHVEETADVAPGHAGMSDQYRRIAANDPIRAGCAILSMSWSEPSAKSIDDLLGKTVRIFMLWKIPLLLIATLWNEGRGIFRDGIKLTQRDYYRIPAPYWKATHIQFVERNDNGILTIASQEAVLKEYTASQAEIYAKMQGETPEYIVLEPRFLYG